MKTSCVESGDIKGFRTYTVNTDTVCLFIREDVVSSLQGFGSQWNILRERNDFYRFGFATLGLGWRGIFLWSY